MVLRLFSAYRDDGTTDKARVLNSVHVLASFEAANAPRPEFWLLLANVLPGLSWDTLTDDDVTDLLSLFNHVPGHETALLAAVQHGLGTISRPELVSPQVQARFWAETFGRKPAAFNGVAPIQVIGSAAGFLDVMQLLDEPTGLRLRMTYPSPPDVMKELLANLVSNGSGIDVERRYLAARRSAVGFDWSSYVNQSAAMIRDAGTASYGNDKASLERLRTPMLTLVADGEASNFTAQVTDVLRSKLNWVLSTANGNGLWDLSGYAMAAASTYALTSIDASSAPSDEAWPAIAAAYLRAMALAGLDPAGGMSTIPSPDRPTSPMQLNYRQLMQAVADLLLDPNITAPARTLGPVSVQPPQ
jgi:hypothetical protein